MKKSLTIVLILVFTLILTACGIERDEKSDAIRFKEEYEKLNGVKQEKNGKTIRTIQIDEDNPFVYKSAGDIIKMINDKKTFAVYFGFSDCPWCRSVVPTLSEVATDLGIKEIYYVDVKDIRDELEVLENGDIATKKKGSKDYLELLNLLGNVLEDYKLTDSDGNYVDTDEKRIYAPNVVTIVSGKAEKMDSGISEDLSDPYMKITKKIKKNTYNKFKCILDCVVENNNNTCSSKAC